MTKQRIDYFLHLMLVVASLATVPLVIAQEKGEGGGLYDILDWLIWAVFVGEYIGSMIISGSRRRYARDNWLSLAVIFLSIPILPGVFELVRLARLIRILRLILVTKRGLQGLSAVLGRAGLVYVAGMAAFLVIVGGALIALVEPDVTPGGITDGIWWAVVTVSTVGYGDIAPKTAEGRILAGVLIFIGIGLVSTLAGSITAYFVEQKDESELQKMSARLVKIEALLQRLADSGEDNSATDGPVSEAAQPAGDGGEGA